MIKLKMGMYCADCPTFEPKVLHRNDYKYHGKTIVDTTLCCVHEATCPNNINQPTKRRQEINEPL